MELTKRKRTFLPEDWKVENWENILPYFEELDRRVLNSENDLLRWQKNRDELTRVISEDVGWRYIKMTLDTQDEKIVRHYEDFVQNIQPKIQEWDQKLDLKAVNNPFFRVFEISEYSTYSRALKKKIEMYRKENLPLFSELSLKGSEFRKITSTMTIEHHGEELTLQQAANLLTRTDRQLRKEIFEKINERRYQDRENLDALMSELVALRHQVATNAGYNNFRDYQFDALGRFDYSVDDCFEFHQSVKVAIVPVIKKLREVRKEKLGFEKLKPYDLMVDEDGVAALTPFKGQIELVERVVSCLSKTDLYFGKCVAKMNELKRLDLESRKGKAPGGYNYPLFDTGVPFIFMNAVGSHKGRFGYVA